jgi:hypothetical protein
MPERSRRCAPPVAPLLVSLPLLAAAAATAQAPLPVEVTNFPALQKVEGRVAVPEPVPHARLAMSDEVVVPPGVLRNRGQLVEAGALDVTGFTRVVLSLAVELRGSTPKPGQVGVVLLPDVGPLVAAYQEDGVLPFALETHVAITPGCEDRCYSGQLEVRLGFPRYRLLFYNTTDRSYAARLYAYLVH